ncbi:MAG: sortase [Candidatus Shapirobacteria bacterium]|nr:sortase [Candidatus Shapirobacteria bacterium]
MSYIYLKKDTPKKGLPKHKKIIILFLILTGSSFLAFAVLPILKFQLEYSGKFKQIIDPSAPKLSTSNILGDSTDYTQLSNWFVNTQENLLPVTQIDTSTKSTYYLSIPKLKISDAVVKIGSMDLNKSLIQYPQTALPGQLGNTVIFGHSVLPQFFNPKNYLTIFSTLYKLNQGDEVYLKYDKSNYKYVVEEMYEVQPTNMSVLEQRYDDKTLTIITCSPPGTYLRRLIIKATLSTN